MVPSGISRVLRIFATVPNWYRSSFLGSSMEMSFCGTAPMNELFFSASCISLMDFSLPMVIGYIVPGNSTAFLRASSGRESGSSDSSIFMNPSPCSTGMIFTSVPDGDKMSLNSFIISFPFVVKFSLLTFCQYKVYFYNGTPNGQSLCQNVFHVVSASFPSLFRYLQIVHCL